MATGSSVTVTGSTPTGTPVVSLGRDTVPDVNLTRRPETGSEA